jgi:hypothetical protein
MPAIDTSTPALVTAGNATTAVNSLTTASFTPPLGALLVVVYSCPFQNTAMVKPTNTGGAVTWDAAVAVAIGTAGQGAVGIWRGLVTTSAAMTVTENPNAGAQSWVMGVVVVTSQHATVNGKTATASSASGTPSVTLSTLNGSNSLCLAVGGQNSLGTAPTIPAGQSNSFNGRTFQQVDTTNGDVEWAQYLTGMNLAAGANATLNDTAPTGISYVMAALEVVDVNGVTVPVRPFIPRRMPMGA